MSATLSDAQDAVKVFLDRAVAAAAQCSRYAFGLALLTGTAHAVAYRCENAGAFKFSTFKADAVPEGWTVLHTVKEPA